MQHTLTRCIGQETTVRVDIVTRDIAPGDRILLCTDGLHKVISEATLQSVLNEAAAPVDACRVLTDLANENEGPDNISTVVLDIG